MPTGGTFVFGRGGDSVWLDPAVVTGGESFRVTGQFLEPLFQYEDGDTAPSNVDPDSFLNYFFGGLSATGQVKKPDAREGYYANQEVADPLYQAATEPAWAKRAPLYEKVERLLQPRMTRWGGVGATPTPPPLQGFPQPSAWAGTLTQRRSW